LQHNKKNDIHFKREDKGMGNYYGIELREKAVRYVLGGGSQMSAADIFDVNRSTICRWIKRARNNQLEPIIIREYASKKLNLLELKKYVNKHREDTITEMSGHFKVSRCAIWYKLKKLGYVIKKNDALQRKRRRTSFRVQEKG
jgi:transposase